MKWYWKTQNQNESYHLQFDSRHLHQAIQPSNAQQKQQQRNAGNTQQAKPCLLREKELTFQVDNFLSELRKIRTKHVLNFREAVL